MQEIVIISIPFLGTSLGAAMVFFMRKKTDARLKKLLSGFASGVMIAASVWSLLLPAIAMEEERGRNAWFPTATGFMAGVGFLLLLDSAVSRIRRENGTSEEERTEFQKVLMPALAVTLHNLPEGMAVGVALAGAMMKNTGMAMAGALTLSIGIAIQNFPEGAIVSMPLRGAGAPGPKAFLYGVLSGAVEPAGAVITVLLAEQVVPLLPYLLAFAAGAMICVVADELIPEAQSGGHGKTGTIGVAFGFVLMMVLDVALS